MLAYLLISKSVLKRKVAFALLRRVDIRRSVAGLVNGL